MKSFNTNTISVRSIVISSIAVSCVFLISPSAHASIDNTFDTKLGPNTSSAEDMGSSVSAGDVNNDGYDDVIVGAYGYNDGQGPRIHLLRLI